MEIYKYKGEWDLPSIDFDCLRVLTYSKLSKAPVSLLDGNPFKSPNGQLPYLVDDQKPIDGYSNIVKYINSKGFDVNHNLDIRQQSISTGYISYLLKYLYPYFQYTLWGDPKNQDDSRVLYGKKTPFPFNFYYPRKYFQKAGDVIEIFAKFWIEDKIENHDIESILIDARKSINVLSQILGDKKWFLGNKSSELDATIYSYLSILLHITLPNNPLQAHIKECSNLVKFVNRITKEYFSTDGFYSEEEKNKKNKSALVLSDEELNKSNKATKILAVCGAIAAMIGFAFVHGIFSVSRDDGFSEPYIEYDDDDDED